MILQYLQIQFRVFFCFRVLVMDIPCVESWQFLMMRVSHPVFFLFFIGSFDRNHLVIF